jgi:hypothetical protein
VPRGYEHRELRWLTETNSTDRYGFDHVFMPLQDRMKERLSTVQVTIDCYCSANQKGIVALYCHGWLDFA